MVILEVPDGVYEEYMFIFLLFVSLFNLLLNLNQIIMNLQYYKFVIQVADDIYIYTGEHSLTEINKALC